MKKLLLILHCYRQHKKDMPSCKFSIFEYFKYWFKLNGQKKEFMLKNRDGSLLSCKIVYYPLPYYKDLRACIELSNSEYREVPVYYLDYRIEDSL